VRLVWGANDHDFNLQEKEGMIDRAEAENTNLVFGSACFSFEEILQDKDMSQVAEASRKGQTLKFE
jgi:hypothetical protein